SAPNVRSSPLTVAYYTLPVQCEPSRSGRVAHLCLEALVLMGATRRPGVFEGDRRGQRVNSWFQTQMRIVCMQYEQAVRKTNTRPERISEELRRGLPASRFYRPDRAHALGGARCASPPSSRTAAISSTNRLANSAFMSDQGIASTASAVAGRRRTGGSSGMRWPAESLSQQELDRRHSSADVRHGHLDALARSALTALEGDPVVTHSTGGRIEQGLADPLEPFRGCLGETRTNSRRITGAVLAHRIGLVERTIRGHHLRRL